MQENNIQLAVMLKYGRIPYSRGGDGFNSIDCISLVHRYFVEFLAIDLPASPWSWRHSLIRLDKSAKLKKNFIIFMAGNNRLGLTDHAGVMLSEADILHAASGFNGIACEPIERYKHRITSVWKPR